MTKIRCTVRNCAYWQGDVCQAEEIEVAVTGGREARVDAGTIGATQAATSEWTCCVTFKPR